MPHPLLTELVDDAALLDIPSPTAADAAGIMCVAGPPHPASSAASGTIVVPTAVAAMLSSSSGDRDEIRRVALHGPLDGPDDPSLVGVLAIPGVRVTAIDVPWPGDDRALGALADLKDGRRCTPVYAHLEVDEHLRTRMSTLAVIGAGVGVDLRRLGVDDVTRLVGEVVLHGVPLAARVESPLTTDAGVGAVNLALAVQRLVDGWPLGDALTLVDHSRIAAEIEAASVDVQRAARSLLPAVRSSAAGALAADIAAVIGS